MEFGEKCIWAEDAYIRGIRDSSSNESGVCACTTVQFERGDGGEILKLDRKSAVAVAGNSYRKMPGEIPGSEVAERSQSRREARH
jgi:hypothetical protein